MVYADRMGRRALRAADRSSLVFAFGVSLGTHRRYDVGAVCRGASRRSDKAGLSRNSRSREETRANPQACAEACFGAVSRRRRAAVARITRSLSSGRPNGRLRPDPVAPSWLQPLSLRSGAYHAAHRHRRLVRLAPDRHAAHGAGGGADAAGNGPPVVPPTPSDPSPDLPASIRLSAPP